MKKLNLGVGIFLGFLLIFLGCQKQDVADLAIQNGKVFTVWDETPWAQAVAVRVAFSALRRRRWRDTSLESLTEGMSGDFSPRLLADPERSPEDQAMLTALWDRMRRIIGQELTKKQRDALVAVRFHGMPLEEVARRMNTNRNALYKLLHDARKRLKERMMAEGMSPQDLLDTLGA